MSPLPAGPADAVQIQRSAAVLTAGLGITHAVLFLLSYLLLTSTPGVRAPDAEILAFYASGHQRLLIVVGLYVMPFSGIAFLWFNTSLRAWTRLSAPPGHGIVAAMQFVSGVLYVAIFFCAAAAFSVMAVSVEFSDAAVDPMVARQLPQYGATLMLVFAMRMAAMFVFTTSRIGRLSGLLPAWFAVVGLIVGLFLLCSATFNRALVLVFPLWLLALCALILRRPPRPLAPLAA